MLRMQRNCNNMRKVLPQSYFQRQVLIVAQQLIGKYLVRKRAGKEYSFMITEVEAYQGENDLASHARFGIGGRSQIMFEAGGHIYIYLIYGIHRMLNIVTEKQGEPSAILIRGVEEIEGPGRLTRELEISSHLNGKVAEPSAGLWFEDRGIKVTGRSSVWRIKKTPRIGVEYAGKWANKPYRFVLDK